MALALRYVAHSEIGLVRKNNQDSAYVSPTMLMVADGMAQPRSAVASPRLHSAYTAAGTAMPPSAATAGSIAWRRSASGRGAATSSAS